MADESLTILDDVETAIKSFKTNTNDFCDLIKRYKNLCSSLVACLPDASNFSEEVIELNEKFEMSQQSNDKLDLSLIDLESKIQNVKSFILKKTKDTIAYNSTSTTTIKLAESKTNQKANRKKNCKRNKEKKRKNLLDI
jgi:hypothetical protein